MPFGVQRSKKRKEITYDLHDVGAPTGIGPSFVTPPMGENAASTFNYEVEVPPVEEVRSNLQHWRWPPPEPATEYFDPPERYKVEKQYSDTDRFIAKQEEYDWALDPKMFPVTEDNVRHTPSNWRFFRPFGQQVAHRFSGEHFSMASHIRNYPIFGMEPFGETRNTYRVEPPPRDITIQDRGPDVEPDTPPSVYVSPNTDYAMFPPSRNWRLE